MDNKTFAANKYILIMVKGFAKNHNLNGAEISIALWDTLAGSEMDRVRAFSKLFLMYLYYDYWKCRVYWISEIKQQCFRCKDD